MSISFDIAHRIADRLAPVTDPRLVAQVERAFSEDEDDEEEGKFVEPAIILGLSSFIVSVASLTWTIFRDERDRAERQAAAAEAAGHARHEAAMVEVAYLKGLVEGRLDTTVDVPRSLPKELRIAVVEAAAEEAVAAGQQARAR